MKYYYINMELLQKYKYTYRYRVCIFKVPNNLLTAFTLQLQLNICIDIHWVAVGTSEEKTE